MDGFNGNEEKLNSCFWLEKKGSFFAYMGSETDFIFHVVTDLPICGWAHYAVEAKMANIGSFNWNYIQFLQILNATALALEQLPLWTPTFYPLTNHSMYSNYIPRKTMH